jgi:hypothetical protein
MSFWSGNPAAPTFWNTLPFQTSAPRFLRTDPPPLLPETYRLADGSVAQMKRLFGTQSPAVAVFLAENYCGDDWQMRGSEIWIGAYLRDPEVVCLGLYRDSELIATIFSVPIGEAYMTHGGKLRCLRMIEGLCVASPYRSKGIAGFMIGHMDIFTTYKFGTCAHLWSRELSEPPAFWDTALRVDKYGYTWTGTMSRGEVSTMPWNAFVQLWEDSWVDWVDGSAAIIACEPRNRNNRIQIYFSGNLIAAVAATGRTSADEKTAIYEIVWSGKYEKGNLAPATPDLNFKQLVDSIAAALPAGGVLFGTTSPDCGGLCGDWAGWSVGSSGMHATYIYNYMPPAFGTCRILMVRDEI